MEKYQENNILLAEFLGWNCSENDWWIVPNLGSFKTYEFKFECDWNWLMMVMDKVRSYPRNQKKKVKIGDIIMDRFEIGTMGIFMRYSKWTKNGWEDSYSYHMFDHNRPDVSDCQTYIEAIYKGMVDFVKFTLEK